MSRSLEPTEGRQLYGQDPVAYALGRPDYPERAYELLASRCGLAGATRVIEVGPGTGLVTRRLLGAGAHVTGIEPNTAMSAYLGRTIADPRLDVIVDAFEDVDLSPDSFDLAVAATSFHWVSQPPVCANFAGSYILADGQPFGGCSSMIRRRRMT